MTNKEQIKELKSRLASVEATLIEAAEGHNSGNWPTKMARRAVAKLIRQRMAIREQLAAAGAVA